MGTLKLNIIHENGHWFINDKPYASGKIYNGFVTHMAVKYTLIFERDETDEFGNVYKCEIRLFTNGRFVIKHFKNGEEVNKMKKYVAIPVNGCLGLVEKDEPGESYGWWRPVDLQKKMDELGLTNVKAKPENSFIIDGRHWRIKEKHLSDPNPMDKDVKVLVKTNGTMHISVPSDGYIYVDFDDNLPIDERYVMVHRKGSGVKGFTGILYLDRGIFNDTIYNHIKANKDQIKLK